MRLKKQTARLCRDFCFLHSWEQLWVVLSDFIPKEERIITIEDSAELQITGIPNLVRLEARNANVEGTGEINIRDLIRTALRMRPERIIVGEVRGKEALDMLQAFICTI